MPNATCLQAETDEASLKLSSDRERSSIPRSDSEHSWQYPSPRMFYNALKRKGKPIPAESVDTVLSIHNFLNESAWREIVAKERLLHPECSDIKLKRFMGRPDELSPKAWWHVNVRRGIPPFDRHDWTVDRCGCEIRYVIDYYEGHADPSGGATFNVDIRPAIDSPQSLLDRFRLFWHEKVGGPNRQEDNPLCRE